MLYGLHPTRTAIASVPATVGASGRFVSSLPARGGVTIASPTGRLFLKFPKKSEALPALTDSDYDWIVEPNEIPAFIPVAADYDIVMICPTGAVTDVIVTEWGA